MAAAQATSKGMPKNSLEAALEKLEGVGELFGLSGLNDSIFNLSTLREEEATGTGAPRTTTPYGVKAAQGTRPNMEDAYSIQMAGPSQHLAPLIAQALAGPDPQESQAIQALVVGPTAAEAKELKQQPSLGQQLQDSIQVPLLPEDLAVLSVFDGHGGTEVAEHCREKLVSEAGRQERRGAESCGK